MSQAEKKNEASAEPHHSRTRLAVAAIAVVLIAIGAGTLFNRSDDTRSAQAVPDSRQAALVSGHSPALGDKGAKVHIVEFLDPACETCAVFFPMVKQWIDEVPGKLRLSVRHVAFHSGSEYPVRVLEASRKQDKYWQTLEALLMSQAQWVQNHTVLPDNVVAAIAGVGLNVEQLMADMNAIDVLQRIEQDKKDAIMLKVSATPEYYVNGRPLPSFGQQQLANLLREELQKAYPTP